MTDAPPRTASLRAASPRFATQRLTMRRSLSSKERLRLFTLHGGVCHLCASKIDGVREAWEVEHVLALALGGDDSDENRHPAHVRCHKAKTAVDVGMKAKADRQRARHVGARPKPQRSMWKRKVNGETVRRDMDG